MQPTEPSEDTRPEPPQLAGEAETLLGFLNFLRGTISRKAGGLDAAGLAQTLPPSTMTLGGMLKHLAYVEGDWLVRVFRGGVPPDPFDIDWVDPDWDWHSAADDSPEALGELYDRAIERSDKIISEALATDDGLAQVSVRGNGQSGEKFSLRWIVVHLIEEYGRHCGHADLLRESIDGSVGE
ncbi:MAG: DinB family protein [Propionibacteriaceae bacterium]